MNLRVPRGPVAPTLPPPTVAAHTAADSLSLLLLVYWTAGLLDCWIFCQQRLDLSPRNLTNLKNFTPPFSLLCSFSSVRGLEGIKME